MAEIGRHYEDIGWVGKVRSKMGAEGALGFGGCVTDHDGDKRWKRCNVVVASGVSCEMSRYGGRYIQ